MKRITILVPMKLAGQGNRQRNAEQGYAMAALLVAMSIMAVMLTVVMPVWKHANQREKEEELVFRGLQYVHAIGMFQRKYANAYPPNVDVLVEQRFLRKKFKDPITGEEFVPIPVGQGLPGSATAPGQRGAATSPTSRGAAPTAPGPTSPQTGGRGPSTAPSIGGPGGAGIQTTAGISGVTSKSKDASIRLYNGRGHYNEWAFVYTPQLQAGQGAPGTAVPGQVPGQRGTGQPGQRGQQPPGTDPFNRGRGPGGPGGSNPFGPNNPPGGRGSGPGVTPVQPIFGPPTTPRGRQ
jgi:type II secretory pathway pseudopilin PulG